MTSAELHTWWYDKFKACGCGAPEAVALLLRDVLECLDSSLQDKSPTWWETRETRLRELLPNDGVYYAFLYRLADLDLEEHGGSSPGWLTGDGAEVLRALKEHGTDPNAWDEPAPVPWVER